MMDMVTLAVKVTPNKLEFWDPIGIAVSASEANVNPATTIAMHIEPINFKSAIPIYYRLL